MNTLAIATSLAILFSLAALTVSCTNAPDERAASTTPPPGIQAWMDRLTVDHEYDPETGFIVAKETVALPPLIADGPRLDEAVLAANEQDRTVIAFATADRCAPCQQFKRSALNDPRVVRALTQSDWLITHVEVDRDPDLADTYLGGRAIPMTYAIRDGQLIATLRGQRSAEDLLSWMNELTSAEGNALTGS